MISRARPRYTCRKPEHGGEMTSHPFVTCLWFGTEAEQAYADA
jgi:hypothetical protein